jgi:predicted RNase H-like nuclease
MRENAIPQFMRISQKQRGLGHDWSGQRLQAMADTLDAIVCAWVAICVLEGQAKPFGDGNRRYGFRLAFP